MNYYCIIPGGNVGEAEELEEEMFYRDIDLHAKYCPNDTVIFKIFPADLSKLPRDAAGPYFGNEKSGHGLSCQHSDEVFGGSLWGTNPFVQVNPNRSK